MTVASEITRIEGNISAAYTAADAKGATMPTTENSANLATCIASISGGGSTGKYQLLQRISDDSNNEIGTVSGFFTDANNVEYAVVCLDAQYRRAVTTWTSDSGAVTNLPLINTFSLFFTDKNTATYNTQKIIDWCTANSYTSDMCEWARQYSFIIDGVTYYGQIPNIKEIWNLACNYVAIDSADTSASDYSNLTIVNIFGSGRVWSSFQYDSTHCWVMDRDASIWGSTKNGNNAIIPVLELPNS